MTYDAYTKRVRFQVVAIDSGSSDGELLEYSEFDFDPRVGNLATAASAFIGIQHNTVGSSASTIETRTFYTSKVDGAKTTLVNAAKGDNNINPVEGEIGFLTFQERDSFGRKKGTGGMSWLPTIQRADGSAASTVQLSKSQAQASACAGIASDKISCTATACVCDMQDGTYRLAFKIAQKGRYIFSVKSTSAPLNPESTVDLSERIYVRQKAQ
jgi:hypothetical protein